MVIICCYIDTNSIAKMNYSVSDGFLYYIELVENKNYKDLFQSVEIADFWQSISEEKSTFRYQKDKWSIKQIIGHITDHERIMTYRALRFSRKDTTLLPGYDQNLYVENSNSDNLSFEHLLQDYKNVRQATLSFIGGLSAEQLTLKGTAWKFELTVEEFLKAIIGHELHHIKTVKGRYL
jgi:uncharacterized damage-inducible protein DinB